MSGDAAGGPPAHGGWVSGVVRRAGELLPGRAELRTLRRAGLVVQRREGAEVVYSVSVPEVRDLLLAARVILRSLIDGQDQLKKDLRAPARSRR